MSISDPILKELKGYATKLIIDSSKPIKDNDTYLQQFCECFERILCKGLDNQKSVLSFMLSPDCWYWLKKLGDEKWGIPYSYTSSIHDIQMNPRVETNKGKTRLLIRNCLVKKCLHTPIQYLVNEGRCCLLYKSNSVLGDTILTSILTSILLCLSTVQFDLDLENAAFLDCTWQLPQLVSLTFVPARFLGLSVMFIEGKAVILNVEENSVAAERGLIEKGDIIDSINETIINKKTQGSLSKIVYRSSKRPISLRIIKGVVNNKLFPPALRYWQQAGLDPVFIQSNQICSIKKEEDKSNLLYFGSVSTGEQGDIKQIYTAINSLPDSIEPLPVSIECHTLGIRVISLADQTVVNEHTFLEISACGSSKSPSHYFGYIAGDTTYTECKDFTCHIFQSTDVQFVENLLKTIGQGFKRTLYTV